MNRIVNTALTLIALAGTVNGARAEVVQAGDSSFSVSHTVTTSVQPSRAWETMTAGISGWWHPDHSWSGDAANFYIRPEIGGCFCEKLPAADGSAGGEVEHLRIIFIRIGEEIRFDGSLGPLVDMAVQGRMHWKVSEAAETESGSVITFTYRVHGFMEGGFTGLAPVVDGVIGQQIERLRALLESEG